MLADHNECVHLLANMRVYRWCPSPGCGNAINALDVVKGAVPCACGFRFCFECHREAHAPATCEQVTAWLRKCKDDSETNNWIYANTQDCPKCKSAIEKNGMCAHSRILSCSFFLSYCYFYSSSSTFIFLCCCCVCICCWD